MDKKRRIPINGYPNRVREYRSLRGLTLKDLSQKSGLFFTQIGKIEKGDRPAKDFELRALGRALNVPPCDLLHFDDGALNPHERRLIERFRRSPQNFKNAIEAFLDALEFDED